MLFHYPPHTALKWSIRRMECTKNRIWNYCEIILLESQISEYCNFRRKSAHNSKAFFTYRLQRSMPFALVFEFYFYHLWRREKKDLVDIEYDKTNEQDNFTHIHSQVSTVSSLQTYVLFSYKFHRFLNSGTAAFCIYPNHVYYAMCTLA